MKHLKKIAVFGISDKVYKTGRIYEAARNKKIEVDFFKFSELFFNNGKIEKKDGDEIIATNYDGAIFISAPCYAVRKEDVKTIFRLNKEFKLILDQFKRNNIIVFNQGIMFDFPYYDKFFQQHIFYDKKIDAIETFHVIDNRYDKVMEIIEAKGFGYPVVIKESLGGMGNGVFKADNEIELEKILKEKRTANLIFQPFIENDGDFRVLVCDGKSLGIMKRIAKEGEWLNNFSQGGEVEQYKDEKMERFAEDVVDKMNLDLAGVDILKTKSGYQVIEVNIFPNFEGFEKVFPGMDVAKIILEKLKKMVGRSKKQQNV